MLNSTQNLLSNRFPLNFQPTDLHQKLAQTDGVIDLTCANPTRCGFDYPTLAAPLTGHGALPYLPEPFGQIAARRALADYLGRCGQPIDPEHLMLCASTSEAYAMLFKLLASPGDAIAVAAPTYPLVQHLAELEGLRILWYGLAYEGGRWQLDLTSVRSVLSQGVRALVVVSPHNPTGSTLTDSEAHALALACRQAGVPLLVDEVFASYGRSGGPSHVHALAKAPLVFLLRGLSKELGLPQLKLGWVAVHGAAAAVGAVMPALQWVADAYLSVGTPVQQMLPDLLSLVPLMQGQIQQRLQKNHQELTALLSKIPALTLLNSDGGWYAIVQLPQHVDEETVVLAVFERAHVALHPGFFYDFARRGYLVCSLLAPPPDFALAWTRTLTVLCDLLGL